MDLDQLAASAKSRSCSGEDCAGIGSVSASNIWERRGYSSRRRIILKTLPGPEKRGYGQKFNEAKNAITDAYESREAELDAAPQTISGIDITEPGRLRFEQYQPGSLHIITQTMNELTALFARMGFTVAEGPEVEDDFHNFEALNIPKIHPARDPLDNFYLDRGDAGGSAIPSYMLRSQTSSVQIRVMETQKPPIRIVAPGRVYRPDTVDATHLFQFHQLEALVVGQGGDDGRSADHHRSVRQGLFWRRM